MKKLLRLLSLRPIASIAVVVFALSIAIQMLLVGYYKHKINILNQSSENYYEYQKGYYYGTNLSYYLAYGYSSETASDDADGGAYGFDSRFYDAATLARSEAAVRNQYFTWLDSTGISDLEKQCANGFLSAEFEALGTCPKLGAALDYLFYIGGTEAGKKTRQLISRMGECKRGSCAFDDGPDDEDAREALAAQKNSVDRIIDHSITENFTRPAQALLSEGQCYRAKAIFEQAQRYYRLYQVESYGVTSKLNQAYLATVLVEDAEACKLNYTRLSRSISALDKIDIFTPQDINQTDTNFELGRAERQSETLRAIDNVINPIASVGTYSPVINYLEQLKLFRGGDYYNAYVGFKTLSMTDKGDLRELSALMAVRVLYWGRKTGRLNVSDDVWTRELAALTSPITTQALARDVAGYDKDLRAHVGISQ